MIEFNGFSFTIPLILFLQLFIYFVYATEMSFALIPEIGTLPLINNKDIKLFDSSLDIEVFASNLNKPTNIAFLESGEAIVLEKETGVIKRISNGNVQATPLLDVRVATFDTRGLVGIAVAKNDTLKKEYVFLYYTEAAEGQGDGDDKCFTVAKCIPEHLPNGNRLYRYEVSNDGSELINQKLIFSWPPFIGATHNGGEMVVGPDNNLYVIVGDGEDRKSVASNSKNSTVDGRAGILALDHNGNPAFKDGILGKDYPLNTYYAYGIRNGFGLDFDPVSKKLWDTENGPGYGDEVNLVEKGFNSGYELLQGFWKRLSYSEYESKTEKDESELFDFNGKGKYSDPEFAWEQPAVITAIKFLNSDKYGEQYKNDLFVVSFRGDIYHFDLDKDRTKLILKGKLKDKIAGVNDELKDITFGQGFRGASDITIGPDGYMYIVSLSRGEVYRITPDT